MFWILVHWIDDASPDSEENVQHWNAANENWNHDSGDGGELGGCVKPRYSKNIANAHAASVAHEEFGWMPVVKEKTNERGC